MRTSISLPLALSIAAVALVPGARAGQEMAQPKDKIVPPLEFTLGSVTLGGQFSDGLQSVFLDSMTALWQPGNAVLFFNGRNSYNDSQQYVYSPGLVARYLVPNCDVILGVNAYYDLIDSEYGNQFGSFGFGAEMLTHWVDARFNYYLPATDDIYLGTSRVTSTSRTVSGPVQNGNLIQTTTTTRTRTQQFNTYEAELEGWNAELGFLIPGLDRYLETRIFGGYYRYNNPFGANYDGFKARLEAHLLPGVIAEVQWYNDAYLNDGHWVGGLRAQVPFDFFNIFHGRNPFEGAGEAFKPRQREFRERLSDMVIRSHRVKTEKSGPIEVSDKTVTSRETRTIGIVTPPPVMNGYEPGNGLEKTGAGTLDLGNGTTNYTGGDVSGGTLTVGNGGAVLVTGNNTSTGGAFGTVNVSDGTLTLVNRNGPNTVSDLNGVVVIANPAATNFNSSQTQNGLNITDSVQVTSGSSATLNTGGGLGTGSRIRFGNVNSGILTVNGSSSSSGETVNGGTPIIGSESSTGAVTVVNGGMLSTGSVSNASGALTLRNGSVSGVSVTAGLTTGLVEANGVGVDTVRYVDAGTLTVGNGSILTNAINAAGVLTVGNLTTTNVISVNGNSGAFLTNLGGGTSGLRSLNRFQPAPFIGPQPGVVVAGSVSPAFTTNPNGDLTRIGIVPNLPAGGNGTLTITDAFPPLDGAGTAHLFLNGGMLAAPYTSVTGIPVVNIFGL